MNTEILGVALQVILMVVLAYPLGKYIAKVYKGQKTWSDFMKPVERLIFKVSGINPQEEMNWKQFLKALLILNAFWFVWGMVLLGRRTCREGGLPLTASNVFANTDAPMALCLGCAVTLLVMAVLYIPRGVVTFSGYVEGFLDGFKLMTPALLVLTFAWGLKSFAARLDAAAFVQGLFAGRETLTALFPLVLFLVGGLLAFATGTSWGTMGILIPVAVPVFAGSSLLPAAVAAVCAGAVMGDHCSPISDTTIMSSTGAGCDHMAHVTTQLWYGLAVGADCAVCYLLAAVLGEPWLPLAAGAALVVGQVFFFHRLSRRREGAA